MFFQLAFTCLIYEDVNLLNSYTLIFNKQMMNVK